MARPSASLGFLIALGLSLAAFVLENEAVLLALSLACLAASFKRLRRVYWVYALYAVGLTGVFVNAVLFNNTGSTVFHLLGYPVRSGAVEGFVRVSLRLLLIAAAGSWFITEYTPVEVARGLERELGVPKGVAYAVAYAFRLMPLVARDYREVEFVRKERGKRAVPVTPSDLASIITPLLRIGYERALWTGISMELRGFSLRRVKREFRLLYR